MEELAAAGVVAFSDDGDPVYDPNLMRLALTYSRDLGLPVINHCQERPLSRGGVMAEGWVATRLGLPGIPAAAEEAMIARDTALAELTGGRLHLAHLSSAGAVSLLRQARERGISVTGEVSPHHLTISDQWVFGTKGAATETTGSLCYDTCTKVFPPLQGQQDVDALVDALAEGAVDCIATDHAPHELSSKQVTYQEAAFGISVLETALGSVLQLVHRGRINLSVLVERLTVGPAGVLGPSFSDLATLRPGTPADVTLFDPDREWVVDPQEFCVQGQEYSSGRHHVERAGGGDPGGGPGGLSAWATGVCEVILAKRAYLVLEDGSVHEGESFGADTTGAGEAVFNTSMTGYQEVLTDPSYAGQLVTLTYPLVGNYGINGDDSESQRIQVAGLVVREHCDRPSHGRSERTLDQFLRSQGIPALSGVDTRSITRRLRHRGVMMGLITSGPPEPALVRLAETPRYDDVDFVPYSDHRAALPVGPTRPGTRWRWAPHPGY